MCDLEFCDARTKLEAKAYLAWLQGVLKFELSAWTEAAEKFKESQMVYENLMNALAEEEQFVYKSKVEELTPSLRYCAYNIGGNKKMDDLIKMRGQGFLGDLDALISQTKNQSLEALQTTEWRGRKIAVRPEKVRLFLISIQNINETIQQKTADNQGKIDIIEQALIDCKDAINALKDEIKQDPKLRNPTGEGVIPGVQYLLSFLSYTRIMMTIERTMYLIVQLKTSIEGNEKQQVDTKKVRPQDISRLYEIILQNVTELQQLQGLENDQNYQQEIDFLAHAFKGFRCYYIALTLINIKRWKEAVAMYERSIKYAENALRLKCNRLIDLDQDIKQLVSKIECSQFSAQAYSVLESDTTDEINLYGKSTKPTKCLFERLSEYKEDAALNSKQPNVFKMPPEMEPVPCKPLFFDLAWNFVEFPSLEDKIQTGDNKKGLSGLVKGFLGWGHK